MENKHFRNLQSFIPGLFEQ